jgi:hypothetical protein
MDRHKTVLTPNTPHSLMDRHKTVLTPTHLTASHCTSALLSCLQSSQKASAFQSSGPLVALAAHSFANVHLVLAMHEGSGLALWDMRCVAPVY